MTLAPVLEGTSAIDDVASAIRSADAAIVRAVTALAHAGRVEADTGLTADASLRLLARRTRWDAAELVSAAEAVRHLPRTADALNAGLISWSQFRAIVRAIRGVDRAGRTLLDGIILDAATRLCSSEPEALVWLVEDKVSDLRADRTLAREDRAIEGSFLSLQPKLGGGGAVYGEADTESFAAIAEALEAAMPLPVDADDDGATRGRQRMDAFVSICESSLAGPDGARPRPRLLATVDARALIDGGGGAFVLAPVAGRPQRLTPLATEVLTCDAEVVPVIFDGAKPVGVGDLRRTIPAKVGTALTVRDGGCRFPGCGAPVAWCDAHHVVPSSRGGDASVDNLVLLCRRCHRRVHRFRWRIRLEHDGSVDFRRLGKRFTSEPRAPTVRRE